MLNNNQFHHRKIISLSKMFRIIISFILIVFLFAGIIGTANLLFKPKPPSDITITADMYVKDDNKLSIKEIEEISAANNYYFTSVNLLK